MDAKYIKMNTTTQGVNDGDVYPKKFEKGKTYEVGVDIGSSLAEVFCGKSMKVADIVAKTKDKDKDKGKDGNKGS